MEIVFIKDCAWNFRNVEKHGEGNDMVMLDKLLKYKEGEVRADINEHEAARMVKAGYAKVKGGVEAVPENVREKETKELLHKKKDKPRK